MKILLVLLVLIWPMEALAAFISGKDLQQNCAASYQGEASANASSYSSCVNYLAGIADAASAFSYWGFRNKYGVPHGSCMPGSVGVEQLRQIWLQYIADNPGSLHLSASTLALTAFDKAWLCENKNESTNRFWNVLSSEQIREAQTHLTTLGYHPGPTDGQIGTRTIKAVRKFQADVNVEASGKLDWDVLLLLKSRVEATANKP